MKRPDRAQIGFTLIELLVVIAIIGILASMILPTLSRGKEKTRMTQCLNNLRQMGIAVKLYVDDHQGKFPLTFAIEPDPPNYLKEARPALGGNDPAPEHLPCFPTAKARPLYNYMRPSEVYRCPVDKGQILYHCCNCTSFLKPSDWEALGCSYHYNAGGLAYLAGGGFKQEPEDQYSGLAGKDEGWVPLPSLYILLHEPPARLYGCPDPNRADVGIPMWYQWHFLRGPSDIEDPQAARQEFISPIAFVDGHVAQHNFSKSLSTDPLFPYEPTKDWIWYKPKVKEVAQR